MHQFRKNITALLLGLALSASATTIAAAEPININTADAATLAAIIDGVGLKRAQAIVAYRDRNGPFQSVQDLTRVRGIGAKTVVTSEALLSAQ
jgi:competence protein ComEA